MRILDLKIDERGGGGAIDNICHNILKDMAYMKHNMMEKTPYIRPK